VYGFQAISANNGWEISFLGLVIVFTGLILLSIAIGQIHRVLALWDNRNKPRTPKKKDPVTPPPAPVRLSEPQKTAARQFRTLAGTLESPFSLPKLLTLAEISGVDRPHANLGTLLENDIIIPDSNGYFSWNQDRFAGLTS
jgi:hypothetical protein